MPLIKSKSKKAFEKNISTEMEHGKPQDQALAIAYSVKRKAAGKKMAKGGSVGYTKENDAMTGGGGGRAGGQMGPAEAANQSSGVHKIVPNYDRAHSEVKHGRSEAGIDARQYAKPGAAMESRDRAIEKHQKVLEELRAMPKPKIQGLAQGGMVESSIIKPHRIDGLGRRVEQPTKEQYMDEEMAYADGGEVRKNPSEMSVDNVVQGVKEMFGGAPKPKQIKDPGMLHRKYAEGGEVEDEHHDSIASAIMARKARMENGRYEHPGDEMLKEGEVDIDDNGKEMPNAYYHQNEEEVLEQNLDADMEDSKQPMDSNEHGDAREDATEDKHDMISKIRSKIHAKRMFK